MSHPWSACFLVFKSESHKLGTHSWLIASCIIRATMCSCCAAGDAASASPKNEASGGIVLLLLEMEVIQHQHHPKTRPEAGREGIVLDGESCRHGDSVVLLLLEVEADIQHQHHPKTRPEDAKIKNRLRIDCLIGFY